MDIREVIWISNFSDVGFIPNLEKPDRKKLLNVMTQAKVQI